MENEQTTIFTPLADEAFLSLGAQEIAYVKAIDLPDGAHAIGIDQSSLFRDGDRLRVKPHDNICLIRSGQDWSDTASAERKMYLDDVEPVLREGMEFLRDEGRSIGCFANRYMTVLDRDGQPVATYVSYTCRFEVR